MGKWLLLLFFLAAQAVANEPALTLPAAIGEALQSNPAIQSAMHEWNAARARVPQAEAWDDPRLSYDQVAARFVSIPADAFTDQSLTVEQTLPISGKNRSRARIALAEARITFEDLRRVQLDVVRRLQTAWYQLGGTIRRSELNRADAESLAQMAAAARAKYGAGVEGSATALQAEIEASQLGEDRLNLERTRSEAETQIRVLLNRPPAAPIALLPAPMPKFTGFNEPALVEQLLASRPEVRSARARLEAAQARAELARREWVPDPTINVNAQRYNGADQAVSQVGAGVSFSLPWANPRKYSAGVQEANEGTAAAAADLQRVRQESLGLLRDQLKRIEVAHHHYALFSGTIAPQAGQALANAQLGYAAGKTGFTDWITARRTQREVETTATQMLADYQTAVAELPAILGAPPGVAPLPEPKPHH